MKVSALFFGILLLLVTLNQSENLFTKLQVTSKSQVWDDVSKLLLKMITNSDLPDPRTIEVRIILMSYKSRSLYYDGFYESFGKFSKESIKIINSNSAQLEHDGESNFEILLIALPFDYDEALGNRLIKIYPNKSTKFILLLRNWKNFLSHMQSLIAYFRKLGFINVYELVVGGGGEFLVSRSKVPEIGLVKIVGAHNVKYLTAKHMLNPEEIHKIVVKIVFCEMLPFSYMENGSMVGADGILVKEFTRKLNIKSLILNSDNMHPGSKYIVHKMQNDGDILLCPQFGINTRHVDAVWLFEQDGICILTPKNIRVSEWNIPFDMSSLAMIILTILLVTACWKLFSIRDGSEISLTDIFTNVCLLTLNSRVDGLEHVSKKLKIMIYSLLFGSFVMISLYESAILSFMLAESSLRSANDLTELNNSNTKFYSFYTKETALRSNLPVIREELVLNLVDFNSSIKLELPDELDENLAYLVSCRLARFFILSPRNFRENRELFDHLSINAFYQRYSLRSGFFFTDVFARIVEIFTESGIRNEILKQTVIEKQINKAIYRKKERDFVEFQDMAFPLILLAIGSIFSSAVFCIEVVHDRVMRYILVKRYMESLAAATPKKLNIKKWKMKYQLRSRRDQKGEHFKMNNDAECIRINRKCKASDSQVVKDLRISGGYLLFGKFKICRDNGLIMVKNRQTVIKCVPKR